MRKAIGYTRVSTKEQEASGLGLEAQKMAIQAYCAREGIELTEIVSEAESGGGQRGQRRKGLREVLDRAASGEVEAVIAANVSRLARSTRHLSEMLDEAEAKGFAIVAIDTGLDTKTPAGKMTVQILAAAAEYERALIQDRTKKAAAAARARGSKWGSSTTTNETREKVATLRAEGKTFQAIADLFNASLVECGRGGSKWYASSVREVARAQARREVA